jgi:redox-sensitive bicupin YhaK (pirin superfamily)
MTAASGILHQEMQKATCWVACTVSNCGLILSSSLKMTDPRYQDIPSSAVPEITDDVAADPNYLDISYLRQLFVHGARAVFSVPAATDIGFGLWLTELELRNKREHEYRCPSSRPALNLSPKMVL